MQHNSESHASEDEHGPVFGPQDSHEHFRTANTQANEFARQGLSNLILLNGGALVAMAPIGSMFEVKISTVFAWAYLCAASFSLGLIFALIGFLIGFLVNSDLSAMFQMLLASHKPSEIEKVRLGHNSKRRLGIVLALFGMAAFFCGVVFGAIALYLGAGSAIPGSSLP